MKGSLKIWMVILGMVVIGIGITFLTNSYVSHQIEKMAETAGMKNSSAQQRLAERTEAGEIAEDTAMDSKTTKVTAEKSGEKTLTGQAERKVIQEDKPAQADTQDKLSEDAVEKDAEIGQEETSLFSETAEMPAEKYEALADSVSMPEAVLEQEMAQADDLSPEDAGGEGQYSRSADTGFSQEKSVVVEITEYPLNLQEALQEYKERFLQIDFQIEQMRKAETENNIYSVKNAAQTEQRIWERELEGIYSLLCDSLDEAAKEELKKEQQAWQQVRDSRAEEAAKKNSGGSLESVDYIASIAASNRERAYGLLEKYME